MPSYKDFGFASYTEYLQSEWWYEVCEAYMRSNLSKYCYICDNDTFLLHHEDYSILGNEINNLRKLVPLCENCHRNVHFDERNQKIPLKKEFLKERRLQLRKKYVKSHLKASTFWYFTKRYLYRLMF